MTSTNEKFIRTFEALKAEVNRRAGATESERFEIDKAASRDRGVANLQNMLRYIRNIRNNLQHPKHRALGHAMEISTAFFEEVEGILNHLKNPTTASSIGVSRKQIKTAAFSDSLGDLAAEMKQTGFSHVPILSENDVVIGVFNEAAIFDYLWSEAVQIVSRDMTIEDILQHCKLDAAHTETFKFVRPGTPIDDLAEMFRALESPTTRVGAVFVTPSGNSTEPVNRLITPWDVLNQDL